MFNRGLLCFSRYIWRDEQARNQCDLLLRGCVSSGFPLPLKLFDGYAPGEDNNLTEGLRDDRVREIRQKKKKTAKSLPFEFPCLSFFICFFPKIDERLNEICRSQKASISRSIDFRHVK